jgi:cytochrome c-type biogenesis protein CcmH
VSWPLVLLLALAAFLAAAFVLKAPRATWAALGAALLLGLAGYASQGHPELPGAPKAPQETILADPAALVAEQQRFASAPPGTNRWLIVAEGFARHGQFANAAEVLRGAVARNPRDADAWVALGNALVAHADGTLSPAALNAYTRAAEADPQHPGPPFFLGLAVAQSGRFGEARQLWAGLLARAPADARWHDLVVSRLQRLDALIAMQAGAGAK